MSDTFTFDVVQAAEIKYAVERNGGNNADLKILSSGDMFARILPILRGYGHVVVELLRPVVEIVFPGADKFSVTEKFVVNTSETAVVKISYKGYNFTNWFGYRVDEAIGASTLVGQHPTQASVDGPIVKFYGGSITASSSLAEVYHLMSLQPKGEEGALLNTGWANVFYVPQRITKLDDETFCYGNAKGETVEEKVVKDTFLFEVNGHSFVLRAVDVHWSGAGWRVNALQTSDPHAWSAEDRLFSRKLVA